MSNTRETIGERGANNVLHVSQSCSLKEHFKTEIEMYTNVKAIILLMQGY